MTISIDFIHHIVPLLFGIAGLARHDRALDAGMLAAGAGRLGHLACDRRMIVLRSYWFWFALALVGIGFVMWATL